MYNYNIRKLKNLIKYLNKNEYVAYAVGKNTIYMSKLYKSKKTKSVYLPFIVNGNRITYKAIKL